jgi:hypothetical protein
MTAGFSCKKGISGGEPVVKYLWLWVVVESVESCSCEKWEAASWGRGQFENAKEGESPPLEAATKQRLMKTEKTLYVL